MVGNIEHRPWGFTPDFDNVLQSVSGDGLSDPAVQRFTLLP